MWVISNLYPGSKAINQNNIPPPRKLCWICVVPVHPTYILYLQQSINTMIFATKLCWTCVIPARVVPLLHFETGYTNNNCRTKCSSSLVCEDVTYWAIGVNDRSATLPRVILITLSPPLNGGVFGASEPYTYVRTLTYPLRFITWGTREMCVFGCACASVSVKETFEVRLQPVT